MKGENQHCIELIVACDLVTRALLPAGAEVVFVEVATVGLASVAQHVAEDRVQDARRSI